MHICYGILTETVSFLIMENRLECSWIPLDRIHDIITGCVCIQHNNITRTIGIAHVLNGMSLIMHELFHE